ncbi:hypothetical protein NVP1244A_033 [Vibrio phage 1.244.A._10N.261.54.C3]|nr:hypothetical protein NVP1244A_033 [Vibrio phage 1.244.A._10N.261.54.C3]AUR98661.1 hypothetical protein NVP1255O_033 [Vibrio phage 1.255.O._10N.286.45.F1]
MAMAYVERPTDPTTHYYSDEDDVKLLEVMAEWRPRRLQAIADGDPKLAPIPEHVGKCVQAIARNIAKRDCYRDYWFKEEMIDEAVYGILRYIHNFDPEVVGERSGKINFFSYVTKSVDRAFGNYIPLEEEQEYFKYKEFERMGGVGALEDEISECHISVDVLDNTDIGRDVSTKTSKYEQKRLDKRIRDRDRRISKQKPKPITNGLARLFAQNKKGEE